MIFYLLFSPSLGLCFARKLLPIRCVLLPKGLCFLPTICDMKGGQKSVARPTWLLPLFLKLSAEPVGTAIENLHRAEKLGLIMDTAQWLGARQLRNFLIHEYIEDLTVLLESLEQAREMSFVLINTANAIKIYAQKIGIDKTDDNQ